MKYKELHRILKKGGCIQLPKQTAGHPTWYSPTNGMEFTTSNHGTKEVARGTLNSIRKMSGLDF